MLKTKLHFEQIPVADVLKIATRPILRGHGIRYAIEVRKEVKLSSDAALMELAKL
jgi:hypothetical protein